MGRIRTLLLSCLILVAAACGENVNNIGKSVQFGLSSLSTRTAYTSDYDGRISWKDGDQVTIHMGWEGGDHLEYEDYRVYQIRNVNQQSYGRLSPVGNSLKWHGDFRDGRAYEYKHTFYSVYPAGYPFDGSRFSLYLPEVQTYMDVSKAPLVAYEYGVTSVDGGMVELHYYPTFITLCVTISNDANLPIGNVLALRSSGRPIAGDYQADYRSMGGGDIQEVVSELRGGEATFFIISRNYEANELSFVLGEEEKPITQPLLSETKYNVTITTKEVEVSSRMTDTEAWFLLAILKNNGGGNNCWNDFESFWKNVYGFTDVNDFNNSGFWNRFNDSVGKASFDEMGELLDEFFPGKLLDSLLTTMSKIEDINLGEGSLASSKKMPDILSSDDFSKLFPNVKTIKLMPQNDITYKFFGLTKLETITLDGGYAVNVTIVLQNCASGITVNEGNNKTVTVEIINTNT